MGRYSGLIGSGNNFGLIGSSIGGGRYSAFFSEEEEIIVPEETDEPVLETGESLFKNQLSLEDARGDTQEPLDIELDSTEGLAAYDEKKPLEPVSEPFKGQSPERPEAGDPLFKSAWDQEGVDKPTTDLLGAVGFGLKYSAANMAEGGAWLNLKAAEAIGNPKLLKIAQADKEYWSGVGESVSVEELDENPIDNLSIMLDPEWILYQASKQATGIIAGIATGGNSVVAQMGAMGLSMALNPAGKQYDKVLKDTGGDKVAAANAFATSFTINSALDKIGLDYMWKPVGRAAGRVTMGFIGEGGTEYTQEFSDALQSDVQTWVSQGKSMPEVSDLIGSKMYEYNKTGLGAALTGGPMGAGGAALTGAPTQQEATSILRAAGVIPKDQEQNYKTGDQIILEEKHGPSIMAVEGKAETSAKVFKKAGPTSTKDLADRAEESKVYPTVAEIDTQPMGKADRFSKAQEDYDKYQPEVPKVAETIPVEEQNRDRKITPEESAKVSEEIAADPGKQFEDRVKQSLVIADSLEAKGHTDMANEYRLKAKAAAKDLGVDLEGKSLPETKSTIDRDTPEIIVLAKDQEQKAVDDAMKMDFKVESSDTTEMTPGEFIKLTTKTDQSVETLKGTGFKSDYKGFEEVVTDPEFSKKEFAKGPAPYIVIDGDGKVIGHEGRHRAITAEAAGVTGYPVTVIYTEGTPEVVKSRYAGRDFSKVIRKAPVKGRALKITKGVNPKQGAVQVKIKALQADMQENGFTEAKGKELGVLFKEKESLDTTPKTYTTTKEIDQEVTELDNGNYEANGQEFTTKVQARRSVTEATGDTVYVKGSNIETTSASYEDQLIQAETDRELEEGDNQEDTNNKQITKITSKVRRRVNSTDTSITTPYNSISLGEKVMVKKGEIKVGAVTLKKTALGMYEGINEVTGDTWRVDKAGKNNIIVVKNNKTIKTLKGDNVKEGFKYVQENSKDDLGADYSVELLKPDDPRYNVHRDKAIVLDSKGRIIKTPDGGQGFKTKKQAIAYVESIKEGKGQDFDKASATDRKVATGAAKAKRKADKDKSETIQVPKDTGYSKVVFKEVSAEEAKAIVKRMNDKIVSQGSATDLGILIEEQRIKNQDALVRESELTKEAERAAGIVEDPRFQDAPTLSSLFKEAITLDKALNIVFEDTIEGSNSESVMAFIDLIIPDTKLTDITVRPANMSKIPSKKGSWYDFGEKTIYYQPLSTTTRTFAHELTHSVTSNEYRSLPDNHPLRSRMTQAANAMAEKVLTNGTVTEVQLMSVAGEGAGTLNSILMDMKDSGVDRDTRAILYSLANPDELFSMSLTDPAVNKLARETMLPKSEQTKKVKTVWDRIKQTVSDLFHLPTKYKSALEEILELTVELSQVDISGKDGTGVANNFVKVNKKEISIEKSIEDRKAQLAEAKKNTTKDGFIKGIGKKSIKAIKYYGRGIDGALGDIHKDLKDKIQKYNSNVMEAQTRREDQVKPWVKALNNLETSDRDLYVDSLFNYNGKGARGRMDEIHKNNKELADRWKGVKFVLDEISAEMIVQGIIPKTRKHYFPNRVDDLQGLMDLSTKDRTWNLQAEVQADLKRKKGEEPSHAEVEEAMASMLSKGVYPAMLIKPGSAKAKTIWNVRPEMQEFYQDPTKALSVHIREATESIEQRKLVGKSNMAKFEKQLNTLKGKKELTQVEVAEMAEIESKIKTHAKDLEDSVGSWLAKKAIAGKIDPADQTLARDLFMGVFHQQKMSGSMQNFKNVSTTMALGQVLSAVTQLSDPGHTAAKYGWVDTLKGVLSSAVYTKDDIDAHTMLTEVGDEGGTQKFLEGMLKATGFTAMDSLFKKGVMNAAILSAKRMTRDGFVEKFGGVFDGDGEVDQLYRDLKKQTKGQMQENPQIKRFVFNELSEIQPITTSSMPLAYNKMKNGKLMYSLKSYNVKQMNNMHDRAMEAGDRAKAKGKGPKAQKAAAFYSLAKYAVMMTMLGAGADELKDILMGRKIEHSETMADNLMKIFLMSKYSMGSVAKGDVSGFIGDFIMPNMGMVEAPLKDAYNNLLTNKKPTWNVLTQVPLFGKILHERFSPDAKRRKMRKLRDTLFAFNKSMTSGRRVSNPDRKKRKELMNEYNGLIKGTDSIPITYETLNRSTQRAKRVERKKALNKKREARGLKTITSTGGGIISALGDLVGPKEAIGSTLKEETQEEFKSKTTKGGPSPMVKILGQAGVEGYEERLYTPGTLSAGDKSGVTIGNGVDLGQQNIAKFRRLGISESIIDKVTKLNLWGKRGDKAQNILDGLTINEQSIFTKEEVAEMSNAITKSSVESLRRKVGQEFWEDLTVGQQAVGASLYHVYGNGWFRHNSFNQFINSDWGSLKSNMEDYRDKTPQFSDGVNNRHRIMSKYL